MIRYVNAEWLKNISTPYDKRKNAIPIGMTGVGAARISVVSGVDRKPEELIAYSLGKLDSPCTHTHTARPLS